MKPQPRYHPGDRIGGRYQVHKALMGGMGEVYLCLDLNTNYPYALKTFQQRYLTNITTLQRSFENEVATWVALGNHPNIVRCFHMCILNNQPFMVLEWVASQEKQGADLRSWLRYGSLDLKLALEIAIDICHGLIHAQKTQPGLVHRDLKPENILMTQRGVAKITDFGLAQIMKAVGPKAVRESTGTNNGQNTMNNNGIVGTPTYMAPEQWRGELLDERTDIYAVGCILYELLTGTSLYNVGFSPTSSQPMQQWLHRMQVAHESIPYPGLPDALPTSLNELLENCLAKVPQERPTNTTCLLVELAELYQLQFKEAPPKRPASGSFTAIDYCNCGLTYATLQSYEQALIDYKSALDLDPSDAVTYNNRSTVYYSLQKYEQALGDVNCALEINPRYSKALFNRGLIYDELMKYELAAADYGNVIDIDPADAETYFNRGTAFRHLKQYEKALVDFNRAIDLQPDYARAYCNRGAVYADLQDHTQALVDYNRSIELDPNYSIVYGNRAYTYAHLLDYKRTLSDCSRAIELDPQYMAAYSTRGCAYYFLQLYDQALNDLNQALALGTPNDAQHYLNRGSVHYALQQHEAALADYSHALELDPSDPKTYYNRGMTYTALQCYEQALADYDRAIALDPNYSQAYVNIGALLGNQGKLAEALAYFEQAAWLGDPTGAQYAAQVRQRLGMEAEPQVDPGEQVLMAFAEADSPEAMRQAATRFPVLVQPAFISAIEQAIAQQVPAEQQPIWQQKLGWLRQLATTQ